LDTVDVNLDIEIVKVVMNIGKTDPIVSIGQKFSNTVVPCSKVGERATFNVSQYHPRTFRSYSQQPAFISTSTGPPDYPNRKVINDLHFNVIQTLRVRCVGVATAGFCNHFKHTSGKVWWCPRTLGRNINSHNRIGQRLISVVVVWTLNPINPSLHPRDADGCIDIVLSFVNDFYRVDDSGDWNSTRIKINKPTNVPLS